jgi:hypothetical protein
MNGTMGRWLLALGAALAFASVGCVTGSDQSESADEEEDIATAGQELDPVDLEDDGDLGDEEEEGAIALPGSDVSSGDVQDPQPQPWRHIEGSPDPTPGPSPDPYNGSMSGTPSGGQSGK